MSDVEMAWAAGLFEGEGCINYGPVVGSPWGLRRRRLNLETKDEDVIRRFASIVGAGNVRRSRRRHRVNRENHSTIFIWECGRWADTERILRAFLPYLGERRRSKAEELLADPAGPIGRPRKQDPLDIPMEPDETEEIEQGGGGVRDEDRWDPGELKIGKVI